MSHTARHAHRCVTAATLAILAIAAACDGDLIGQDRYGPPESWELGPVEQGSQIRLPTNPCPPKAATLRMDAEPMDYTNRPPPGLARERISIDDDLSLEVPSDANLGTWAVYVTCQDASGELLRVDSSYGWRLEWELEVIEPG